MNSGFINRLVGTSIVVVAAIIFIPNILDGEKVHYKDGFKAIPERPEFTTVDLKTKIDLEAENAPEVQGDVVEMVSPDDAFLLDTNDDTTALVDNADSRRSESDIADELAPTLVKQTTEQQSDTKAQQETPPNSVKPAIVTTAVSKAKEPKRAPTSNLTKMAYVIQLGSFSHKPNVDALVQKLKKSGFKAFTRPVKTPNGTLTKVFVGPDLDKSKLESKLAKLKELTKLNGRLTQFNIAK
ncbi:SPOR domain-containing protein [Pseudoalteromonas aurantia]|uniref:DedD protein n=1 Tax=Pseudoalteromonas aurantia TaxID=43654 RepID=A0A5S3V9X3_9GAMM|nr:SPOR domain-containing protein [Pseudoalteromonas aurantia]TMO56830.1 DedD protein [Pseudoalteromonas aurantia]TMO68289.1 DedD protein [Pseudoalteromonas aurantia]TMO71182.1 DedD protein [Pseudoalteromonas aurantia]